MSDETIEIEATVIAQTEQALLLDDGDIEEWVPKSQMEGDLHHYCNGDCDTFILKEWIAIEKGFI